MTIAEKIELALIPVLGVSIWLMGAELPASVSTGALLLGVSILLLLQSLIRDLWLLTKQRRATPPSSRREARCMCVESAVGATGVTVGLMVLGSGIDLVAPINGWNLSCLAAVVMVIGFVIKDYVLEWKPFRIRRDKDHVNIVFTWKG
jgi:hypothetical protein